MKALLGSFRARLVLGAVLWISVGFIVSWLVLIDLLRDRVMVEFESELDHHATELAELAERDPAGAVTIRAPLSDHRFSLAGSGYYWQITQIGGVTLVSGSLGPDRLPLVLTPGTGPDHRRAEVTGPTGPAMLLERLIEVGAAPATPVRVAIALNLALIDDYLAALQRSLAIAMACLAAGLILAAIAQISFALRPLARIDDALRAVRRGDLQRLPPDLPVEVRPLVDNLNDLLAKNETMIQRARLQAGNLAHALKTSLAHLQIEAESLSQSDRRGAVIQAHCDIIYRQIDYQLARARATASRAGGTEATEVGPVIDSVVAALRRLHPTRRMTVEAEAAQRKRRVPCSTEDLEEVLGNLIDNAAKWAKNELIVSVTDLAPGKLLIRIEDDGPGMPADMHERAFRPGERLDESTPGSGLGLAIARDVVSLYDGRMWIETSRYGGAAVSVELNSPA